MGQSAQAGQVIFRTQAAQGTYQADTGTAGIAMKLRGGTLAPNRDLLVPDPEIGGGRDVVDAYLGAVAWSGDYEFYGRPNGLLTLLNAALGVDAPTTATGITTHVITPSDTTIPWLSIEETIAASMETFHYWDAKVNTLHLESDANGYLQGTAGLIAARQQAGQTKTVAAVKWDNTPMPVGTNITVQYNGVSLPARSFSFDLTNNIEADDYRLGSFFVGDLVPKRREVTFGVTIRPQDSALWRQAVYGTPTATTPGGVSTKQPLIITISTYENIPAGTPPTPYSLSFNVPNAIIQPYAFSPSGDDVIQNDLTIQAVRPNPATPLMTTTVKSDLAVAA